MPSLWDVYLKVPPVTRFLCVSTLAVTLPVILESLSPRWLVFVKRLVFKNLEVRATANSSCHDKMLRNSARTGLETIHFHVLCWYVACFRRVILYLTVIVL